MAVRRSMACSKNASSCNTKSILRVTRLQTVAAEVGNCTTGLQSVAKEVSGLRDGLTSNLDAYFAKQQEAIEAMLAKRPRHD